MCACRQFPHSTERQFAVAMSQSVVFKEWTVLLSEKDSSYIHQAKLERKSIDCMLQLETSTKESIKNRPFKCLCSTLFKALKLESRVIVALWSVC